MGQVAKVDWLMHLRTVYSSALVIAAGSKSAPKWFNRSMIQVAQRDLVILLLGSAFTSTDRVCDDQKLVRYKSSWKRSIKNGEEIQVENVRSSIR